MQTSQLPSRERLASNPLEYGEDPVVQRCKIIHTENSFEEDLVPLWSDAFSLCESESFVFICTGLERTAICNLSASYQFMNRSEELASCKHCHEEQSSC